MGLEGTDEPIEALISPSQPHRGEDVKLIKTRSCSNVIESD